MFTKTLALLALVAVSATAMSVETSLNKPTVLFAKFKKDFNRVYKSAEEEAKRFAIFVENIEIAAEYQRLDKGAVYTVTQHMDLSREEFAATWLGMASKPDTSDFPVAEDIPETNETSIDWVAKGAVTPVKNQGQCGSCWAFSTTGNLEGVGFLKNNKLVSLSEQQLVDCDTKTGDKGCQGGLPSNAYKYILGNKGIDTEASYPYQGVGETCAATKGTVGATISNWTAISQDEKQIAAQLVARGPLSIGINAGPMQFYGGGVSCPWKVLCNPKQLDHGVLIVGFGTDASKGDYWKIKNSWGPGWGEQGYYRICRGKGACGLNTMVTSSEMN
jgi:cathepsin F|eukprot:g5677.t1